MKTIYTNKKIAIIVDDCNYEFLNKYTWHITRKGYAATCMREENNKNKKIFMHRLVLMPVSGKFVDHINGIKLDNRMENLRMCTLTENNQNSRSDRNPSSKLRGVHFRKDTLKWTAQISVCGKRIRLGDFHDKYQAHEAYKSASIKYHGEFSIYK